MRPASPEQKRGDLWDRVMSRVPPLAPADLDDLFTDPLRDALLEPVVRDLASALSAATGLGALAREIETDEDAGVWAGATHQAQRFGVPPGRRRAIPICSASTTSSARTWSAIDQPTIRRENASWTAARYNQPSQVRREVTSAIGNGDRLRGRGCLGRGSRGVQARRSGREAPRLHAAFDRQRRRIIRNRDEPEYERRVDAFADQAVHRERAVADRLDLTAVELRHHVVVSDVHAKLVAAAPATRVAAQPTGKTLPGGVPSGDPDVDQLPVVVPDRIDACAATRDDGAERGVLCEAVRLPVLELLQRIVCGHRHQVKSPTGVRFRGSVRHFGLRERVSIEHRAHAGALGVGVCNDDLLLLQRGS
jgi:hypothetical protein